MLKVRSLPAGEGDALWIEWGEAPEVRRMIIDMGRSRHGKAIREMLSALDEEERIVELLVITHVDRDHIEGVLEGFVKPDEASGVEFKEIWFNGWNHLHGLHYAHTPSPPYDRQVIAANVQTFGAFQGEQLTPALAKSGVWNTTFDGMPVVRPAGAIGEKITLEGGLSITVLGPTQQILGEFINQWIEEIKEVEKKWKSTLRRIVDQIIPPGLQTFGRRGPPSKPILDSMTDLEALAAHEKDKVDGSSANGSSICLVLEYEDKRILMTGDAHSDNLIASLELLHEDERSFDLVKLPHHGSAKNVSAELIEKLDCPKFLISTSGSYFYHPDAEAIARIICHAQAETPEILFNVPSIYNGWWDNADWKELFSYEVSYGSEANGLTVSL